MTSAVDWLAGLWVIFQQRRPRGDSPSRRLTRRTARDDAQRESGGDGGGLCTTLTVLFGVANTEAPVIVPPLGHAGSRSALLFVDYAYSTLVSCFYSSSGKSSYTTACFIMSPIEWQHILPNSLSKTAIRYPNTFNFHKIWV